MTSPTPKLPPNIKDLRDQPLPKDHPFAKPQIVLVGRWSLRASAPPPAPRRPTKSGLLQAYERELRARYAWTADEAKLANFMAVTKDTLNGHGVEKTLLEGDAWEAALKAVGLSKLPLHRLRDLPT